MGPSKGLVDAGRGPGGWRSSQPQQHWSVTVSRNGENILTTESNCLSGRNLSDEDEACIRNCVQHLLSFVGEPRRGE